MAAVGITTPVFPLFTLADVDARAGYARAAFKAPEKLSLLGYESWDLPGSGLKTGPLIILGEGWGIADKMLRLG